MYGRRFEVRAGVDELVVWRGVAAAAGLSLSVWARRALNEQADLDAALRRQEVCDGEEADAGGEAA